MTRSGTRKVFLLVTQHPGPTFITPIFSPSRVTVNNGLTLTMVPDSKYSSLGYRYQSGVVTTAGRFTLERLHPDQSQDARRVQGRLARHLVH